jgi:vacuolar-type H+-ATPase subunit E/Vma4
MITLLEELIFVVGISVLAHAGIAYVLAPRKAKESILRALTEDQDFQTKLVESILNNFLKPKTVVLPDGSEKQLVPIDPIIQRAKEAFQEYIQNQQKEIEKSAGEYAENVIANQENPMLAMVLSQVPKKYRWLLPFVAQFMQNR